MYHVHWNLVFISLNRLFPVFGDGRHRPLLSKNWNSQTFLQTKWFFFCLFHYLTALHITTLHVTALTKPCFLFPQLLDSSQSEDGQEILSLVPISSVASSGCQCCEELEFLRRHDGWFSNIHFSPDGWVYGSQIIAFLGPVNDLEKGK